MFDMHKNHRNLVNTAIFVFLTLSTLIAIIPAYQMQSVKPLPTMKDMTKEERHGLGTYVSENCAACHTQQVRNIEMDNVWGNRPSMPSDYYYSKQRMDFFRQSPSLLGSERTGPDLTNIGKRQSGKEWHLLHLYNPRIVVKESIMPSYPWLFIEKDSSQINKKDVIVPIPDKYLKNKGMKIVATQKALNLVAYLQSLKQPDMPSGNEIKFIPSTRVKKKNTDAESSNLPDGSKLYSNTCAACHQPDGKGLSGAFPPLAGSPIVNDENHEQFIKIILQGYDAREEFGVMPPFADQLSDEEIAAIVNHEKSSWGNNAPKITAEDVKKIRDYVNALNP